MKLDRSTAGEQRERKVLPAGTYRAKVESSIRKTSKSGTLMWEVQLSFPEEPDAKWVYDYFLENEKSQWKFFQFYDAIGLDSDDTDDMKDIFGEEPLVNLVVETDQTYGDRNKVQRYIKLPEVDAEPEPEPAPKPAKKAKTGAKITLVKEEDLPF